MKKSIIFAAMLSLMATTFAQSENIFNIKHSWMKMVGYSYQPAYPYGFSTAGGSFLSFGFGENGKYFLTNNGAEHIEPTWSMRLGWVGYTFDEDVTDWGAITFRPMLVLGMDMTKDHNQSTGKTEKNTYFTMTPTLAVNIYMVHFSVGYEIVPKLKEFNGLTFGVGFSVPHSRTTTEKLNSMTKKK